MKLSYMGITKGWVVKEMRKDFGSGTVRVVMVGKG